MIVSLPVSCSTYVASASAETLVWMRSCVVIGVKGSGTVVAVVIGVSCASRSVSVALLLVMILLCECKASLLGSVLTVKGPFLTAPRI